MMKKVVLKIGNYFKQAITLKKNNNNFPLAVKFLSSPWYKLYPSQLLTNLYVAMHVNFNTCFTPGKRK